MSSNTLAKINSSVVIRNGNSRNKLTQLPAKILVVEEATTKSVLIVMRATYTPTNEEYNTVENRKETINLTVKK